MDILFLLVIVAVAIGLYLAFDNKQLRKDYTDLIIERDDLRIRLDKAEANDGRNSKGQYTGKKKK